MKWEIVETEFLNTSTFSLFVDDRLRLKWYLGLFDKCWHLYEQDPPQNSCGYYRTEEAARKAALEHLNIPQTPVPDAFYS